MSKTNRNVNIFIVGFLILSLVWQWSFMMDKYASPFDYEGFSFQSVLTFVLHSMCILVIMYRLKYPKPSSKQLSYPAQTSIILLLGLLIMILFTITTRKKFNQKWKYSMPLKKIDISVLEGNLMSNVRVSEAYKANIVLEEHPNISFGYPKEELENRIKMGEKKYKLLKGGHVKLKIRSDIYNHIINNTTNRAMERSKYKDTYYVPYYSLTHKDSLIFEKMYLK